VDFNGLKGDVSVLKGDISALKGDVSAIKTDIRELGYSMKEQLAGYALKQEKQFSQYALNQEKQFSQYAVNQEKQLAQHAQSQDKQFSQFYLRSLYGVSLTLYCIPVSNEVKVLGVAILLVGSSWILPMNEATRLEAEIMRRVIIREGMGNMTEIMHLDSKTKGRANVPEDVEKESEGK